jgi:hypothetical protein
MTNEEEQILLEVFENVEKQIRSIEPHKLEESLDVVVDFMEYAPNFTKVILALADKYGQKAGGPEWI